MYKKRFNKQCEWKKCHSRIKQLIHNVYTSVIVSFQTTLQKRCCSLSERYMQGKNSRTERWYNQIYHTAKRTMYSNCIVNCTIYCYQLYYYAVYFSCVKVSIIKKPSNLRLVQRYKTNRKKMNRFLSNAKQINTLLWAKNWRLGLKQVIRERVPFAIYAKKWRQKLFAKNSVRKKINFNLHKKYSFYCEVN